MPGIAKKIPFSEAADSLHFKILDAVKKRKEMSYDKMSLRYEQWRKDEESFLAYLPEREVDASRRVKREAGKPQYTTVELPYSYSILMASVAYWAAVFLSRDPIFQFSGRHGESEDQIKAMEALIDYQRLVGQMLVPLYVWLNDGGKYGLGVIGTRWAEEFEVVSSFEEVQDTYYGLPVEGKTKKQKVTRKIPGYVGNRLYNVKPTKFFPDTRKAIKDFQQGEFVIIETTLSWNAILIGQEEGEYFNIDILKQRRRSNDTRIDTDFGSQQIERPSEGVPDEIPMKDLKDFQIDEAYIELVPKQWGLGNTSYPEKWMFTIANKEVIIGCRPLGSYSNKYPFEIIEYEIDGYAIYNRSQLDIVRPLNNVITWLFNSHFYNVRKALNDMFIVDPSKVVMKDLLDPAAGKLIRLKPSAYGTDLKSVMQQFQVVDVTAQHLKDVLAVIDFAQRVTGVSDNTMGVLDPRGRKTATEVRSAGSSGSMRMKTITEYMSAMGWEPLARQIVQNTQQYWSMERTFRIAGDTIRGQQNPYIDVSPSGIAGFFDFIPVDGTMPVDRFMQASLWRDLMKEGVANPQIAAGFNWVDMFGWVAQLAGMKNINRFRVNIRPDESVAADAQAGNLIPLGEDNVRGVGTGTPSGRRAASGARNNEGNSRPTQSSGVGPAA